MNFDVQRAMQHRVVLLAGSEPFLRREAIAQLIEAASGGDDFDVETFVGDSSTPQEWAASASTAPFLSPRRVALVRNVLRADVPDVLDPIPETGLLILVADDESSDDQKKYTVRLTGWTRLVQKAKGLAAEFKFDANTIVTRLRDAAKELGKELSPKAATLLKEMCGDSLSRALEELQKAVLYAGDSPHVSEQVIRECVFASREWKIFALTDAVIAARPAEAMRQVSILIGGTTKPQEVVIKNVLPMMSRALRLQYQARILIETRSSVDNISDSVRAMLPAKPNLLSEKDYPRQKAMENARKLSTDQIARCMVVLAETDARVKGMIASHSISDALEQMVLEMVAICAPVAAR